MRHFLLSRGFHSKGLAAQLSCKTVWCHERRELDAFAFGEGAAQMRKSYTSSIDFKALFKTTNKQQ